MQVRKTYVPLVREKKVVVTKRLPLWRYSDEMYLDRQLAPDVKRHSHVEIKKFQGNMIEQARERQRKDMVEIERELSRKRFPPKYPVGELRRGQWLDGRITKIKNVGVMVDVGAYTEAGQWLDGYCSKSQFREDAGGVETEDMWKYVYVGEPVRVRVDDVNPATSRLVLSMRTDEDLPELFLGQRRKLSIYDLKEGVAVTGIIRRVFKEFALVDIGSDFLCALHVREHRRKLDPWGFPVWHQLHKTAYTAYPRGAQMECWIKEVVSAEEKNVHLTCVEMRVRIPQNPHIVAEAPPGEKNKQEIKAIGEVLYQKDRKKITKQQAQQQEMAIKEKAPFDPYVPYVDEWIDEASEPNEEQDSWVAMAEKELFEELEEKKRRTPDTIDEAEKQSIREQWQTANLQRADTEYFLEKHRRMHGSDDSQQADEEFAEDDFAEDDFTEDDFAPGGKSPAGPSPEEQELEGWQLTDQKDEEDPQIWKGTLSEEEIDAIFEADQNARGTRGWNAGMPPKR